jgi:anti-anti-sigma factor
MQMTVVPSEDPAVVRLKCEGQISQSNFQPGVDPIEHLLGPGCFSRKVLLNLEKTEYIDSSGISWLIACHKHFLKAGGKLVLHSIPPMVYQALQWLRMPLILHLADDEPTARALALGEKK